MAASMEATILYIHVEIKDSWAFTVNCSGIKMIFFFFFYHVGIKDSWVFTVHCSRIKIMFFFFVFILQVTTDINEALINIETRSLAVTRQGVYFAFYDQGACTTLLSVRVYHIMCPSVVLNFTRFPNTTTGPDVTSIVQTEGVCVEGAGVDQPPSFLCKGDGHWYFATGRCRCEAGYQPDELDAYCTGERTVFA